MQRPELIVIDLDGTLIDSAPDIAFAASEMLSRLGRAQVAEKRIRDWIGNGADMLVKRALTGEMRPEEDPPEFQRALDVFSEIYADNVSVRSSLYPGVIEGLQQLDKVELGILIYAGI